MRENDEITGLFRSRLAGAEMTVREDFWEGLQRDLPSPVAAKGRRPLMAFVAELPDGCRTVFNLYVFEEKSHKEIAEILHIKEHFRC